MDLKVKLKELNPTLYTNLQEIKNFSERVWKNNLMPWFTNHNLEHSEEIITLLGQILKPIEHEDTFLDEQELFILLSSAYLHDIGMQYLKDENISIESLTANDFNNVRIKHAQKSFDIILSRNKESLHKYDLHPPTINREFLPAIAEVSKGHATDHFENVCKIFENRKFKPNNKPIRGKFLVSLLMIADEFDLQKKRINFDDKGQINLSPISELHWFKHHFIDSVEITNNILEIDLSFPNDFEEEQKLFEELIQTKLEKQIEKVNPIFKENSNNLLFIKDIKLNIQDDYYNEKDKPSLEVIELLKKELGKDVKKKDENLTEKEPLYKILPIKNPDGNFIGRENELNKLKSLFFKKAIILIEGIGGIGKSELCLKYIERENLKEKTIFYEATTESTFDTLIEYSGYPYVLRGENKTQHIKNVEFLSLLERDGRVLILDNFQEIKDEYFFEFLNYANNRFENSQIVLLSRVEDYKLLNLYTKIIKIGGLNKAFELAKKIIDKISIDDNKLKTICEETQNHPLAIKLAIQLLRYGRNEDNILKLIVGMKNRNEELSKRLLDEIFNNTKSTNEEREFILAFSVFKQKVEEEAIVALFDSDISMPLYSLMDKLIIEQNSGFYETHPLIREFCYDKLNQKEKYHQKAGEYFNSKINKFHIEPIERVIYHFLKSNNHQEVANLIIKFQDEFINQGFAKIAKDTIDEIYNLNIEELNLIYGKIFFLWGEYEKALNFYEKIINTTDNRLLAKVYLGVGQIKYHYGESEEAKECFEKAKELSKDIDKKSYAFAENNLGIYYRTIGEISIAMKQYQKALEIAKEIRDEELKSIVLNNIGTILGNNKNTAIQAIQKFNEALEIAKKQNSKLNISTAIINIGQSYHKLGKYEEALKKYNEALQISKEIGDKRSMAIVLGEVGRILQNYKKQYTQALKKYEESLKIEKELNDIKDISSTYHNIGTLYFTEKKYDLSINNLLLSLALINKSNYFAEKQKTIDFLKGIKKVLKQKEFNELIDSAYMTLDEELREFVKDEIEVLKGETQIDLEKITIGRNEPCYCGSGKKYKKCCGKVE